MAQSNEMLISRSIRAPKVFSLWSKVLLIAIVVLVGFMAFASPSHGASATNNDNGLVKVVTIKVGGFVDPQNESLINDTLQRATKSGVSLYVIQLDSNGIAGGDVNRIASKLKSAELVTAIWVGPTSAKYSNELDPILESVDVVGAANKSLAKKTNATIIAPSLREFYAQLDGQMIDRLDFKLDTGCSKKEVESKTAQCKDVVLEKDTNFALNIAPLFEKLSPIENLGHSLIKPSFAIGLLVLGLFLLVFEFYAASVGVSAVSGTIASLCGIYGLGYLPTNWWAIAVLIVGVGALVIDVQAGGVGFYTFMGSALIFGGAFFATERTGAYGVSIVGASVVVVLALLFSVGAIPSLIRTRFGTATIGREDFIGEIAIADGDIDPEGNVKLRGGSWKARANHATPIKDGDECKIVKIEGIVLEVEPLVGAAVDYREKRAKS
ncbi:MAG TPA: NfeD family protein [Acidimicrobiia bacterium]|nr:NfeD family protein [Acidimicrobiia bacterium]